MAAPILIIDCGSDKTQAIQSCLEEINVAYNSIQLEDFSPETPLECSGIIIGGAPILLSERDITEYLWKFTFLTEIDVPVLGICFGHQILGLVFGAQISAISPIKGEMEINIEQSSTLLNYLSPPVTMEEDHTEEISLPNGFKLLATSASCNNEAMQHIIKPLFGVQFHPEVSGRPGLQLLKNFCKTCS